MKNWFKNGDGYFWVAMCLFAVGTTIFTTLITRQHSELVSLLHRPIKDATCGEALSVIILVVIFLYPTKGDKSK